MKIRGTITSLFNARDKWPEPSKPRANPRVGKLPASCSPPRRPVRMLRVPALLSHAATGPVPSLSVRSASIRSPPICSSARSPSSASSARSPRITKKNSGSNHPPFWRFKKPPRHTLQVSSRTRICVRFMQGE